ncbi:MAG TPA: flagellar basal body P-ring formation protein FlgA [Phycisphaerae bacterium]|nr:flagellar basal body P-ring formation protein FlgA [Phycisphaerae bacterium]
MTINGINKHPAAIAIMIIMFLSTGLAAENSESAKTIVYLPREITAANATLTMDDICIISGTNEPLISKIEAVTIGRGPVSKEALVIDRKTILSRLAACGINTSMVKLSGAREVAVRRNEKAIKPQTLIDTAEKFMKTDKAVPANILWQLAEKPKELIYAAGYEISITARLGKTPTTNLLVVEVVVLAGKDELAVSKVNFKPGYAIRKIIATKDIPAGGALTPSNVRFVETVTLSSTSQVENPFAMFTSKAVKKNAEVSPTILRHLKPKMVIRRNRPVVMKIEGGSYVIQMTVLALQDGKVGELIKVRNIDSKITIIARVKPDGSVEPAITAENN